ncbi:hypothetical protein B9Z55_011961 [Caenorhabditis nigoni]|uniref:Glycosyltransferase family 92 protein n=1 Tax=Caenorhabditis nigoni TaxID=1611254 RepID=A0A2G5TV64_9PELO|nr:hypothetical protein B9Z55_011961 [Caenorhabditis nigoni]
MSMIIRLLAVSFSIFALANYLIFNWKISNVDQNPLGLNNRCYVPDWNRVNTESIKGIFWNNISRWLWMRLKLSNENLHNNTETSIFAAYLYHNKISITITSQHLVQQKVYCRYYDCERKEIPGSSWHGMVFPESVVDCPRRYGAEFVSVSKSLEEQAPAPVKLIYRLYKEPVHELAVCLSPMYGKQPSWLSIVDFVEHHKLEGVTQFYFYVGEISDHDEKILNDYVRLV